MVLNNGKKVKSAKEWWQKRRPEIVEAFDREIYGRLPANVIKVTWTVVSTKDTINGRYPIKLKKLMGHVNNSAYPSISVDINLTLTTPARASGPVPVMMEFAFQFPVGFRPPQPSGPVNSAPNWEQQLLDGGMPC